jgi:hypothetical protein
MRFFRKELPDPLASHQGIGIGPQLDAEEPYNCEQLIQNQLFDHGVRGIPQIIQRERTVRHKRKQSAA